MARKSCLKVQKPYEKINWLAAQRTMDRTKSKVKVQDRHHISESQFQIAVQRGDLILPDNWDCIKYATSPGHPAKGVACEIRQILEADQEDRSLSFTEIAEILGCSQPNIVYHATKMGLNRPPQRDLPLNRVEEVLSQTGSFSTTARYFAVSDGVISKLFHDGLIKCEDETLLRRINGVSAREILRNHGGKKSPYAPVPIIRALVHKGRKKKCESCGRHHRKDEPRSRLRIIRKNGRMSDLRASNLTLRCVRCESANMSPLEIAVATGRTKQFWATVQRYFDKTECRINTLSDKFKINEKSIYEALKRKKLSYPPDWKNIKSQNLGAIRCSLRKKPRSALRKSV